MLREGRNGDELEELDEQLGFEVETAAGGDDVDDLENARRKRMLLGSADVTVA